MAVRKASRVSRVRRPVQEPDNPYTSGGPSGALPPGESTPESENSSKGRKKKGPLSPEGYEFPTRTVWRDKNGKRVKPGTKGAKPVTESIPFSSRSNRKWTNPAYLQYLPMQPGYLKYFEQDVAAPLIAGRGNPGLIAELQRQLAAVGLISSGVPRGVWDPKTEKGYRRLLEIANVWGMSDQAALNQMLAEAEGVVVEDFGGNIQRRSTSSEGEGGGGRGFRVENGEFVEEGPEAFVPPPLELQLPNPDDIGRVVRKASIDMMGQALDQGSVNAMTSAYIAEVTRLQRDAYNRMVERERQLWETGTSDIQEITSIEAPSAEGFAERELENRPETKTNKGMELLMNLIGQWG